MFTVQSTSVETRRIARVIRVLQRRPVALRVKAAYLFNCKKTVGTDQYSAHAFGDAVDLMIRDSIDRKNVAHAIVHDAEHRTIKNFFRRTDAYFVIYNDRQWVKGQGWTQYTGVPHTDHVHAACSGSTTQVPACAGGHNLPVAYVRKT